MDRGWAKEMLPVTVLALQTKVTRNTKGHYNLDVKEHTAAKCNVFVSVTEAIVPTLHVGSKKEGKGEYLEYLVAYL